MSRQNSRKRSKRQHLVPQFYLQHFARRGKVWIIDFHAEQAPYQTNTTNALCVSDFYTVSTKTEQHDDIIEQYLSKIESAAKPIIERILKDMVIPEGKDKETLAVFLATLFLRGPHARQVELEFYEGMIKAFSSAHFSDDAVFDREWHHFVEKNPETTLTKDGFRMILEDSVVEGFMTRESYVGSFLKMLPRQAAMFNQMVFSVWWADPSARPRFVSGDFPFVFEDKSDRTFGVPLNGGLLNKNIRIYVPLSPLTCLILERTGESMIYPIRSGTLIPITNSQVALSATRYVVSESSELYWYKDRQIHRSAEGLHEEFYPAKLEQPAIELIPFGHPQKVTARNKWNKLRGDTPPEGGEVSGGRSQGQVLS